MPRTNNENLISGTETERVSVTLDAEQLVKDTTSQALFVGDGSTAGGRAVDVRPVKDITANYTLVRADEGKILRFNSSSAITITIPTNVSVGYPANLTRIPFINLGAGVVTFVGDTGVTLSSVESNIDTKESGDVHKTATNAWFLTKGGSGASAIGELTDVQLTNLQNTQTLQYNSSTSKWQNVNSTDANTTYDLGVPAATTNLRLTGSDGTTDNVTLTGSGATSIARTSATQLTISSTDADTTYAVSSSTSGSDAKIDLTASGSGSGTSSVTLAAGSNITISETGDTITLAGTAGTVTSVGITGGTGLSVSGSPITSSGSVTLANTGVTSNVAGSGISVSGATGAVTISNTGVTSAVAGTGISVSGSTGAVTFTNSDLGSSQNIFKTISVGGQSDIVADTNADTLTLAEGSNITLTTNAGTDTLTITGTDTTYSAGTGIGLAGTTFSNTDLGSSQNIFKTITVSGQSDIVADSNSDTLTVAAGSNVSLTTSAGSDTLTIASTDTTYSAGSGLDLAGTTFSVDVSDFMANGVNNRILTATGTDAMNAESGLTFDGTTLTVGGSVVISSDLTVNGTTTTINTQTLTVDDPMVVVGDNNAANSVDLGIIGKYVDTNTYYSGLLRDASAGKFRLFTTTEDLSSATTVDPTDSGYANSDLIVGAIQQSGATNGIVFADANGNLLGGRTISEGVGIDITNGSGVSGNPTITLDLSELSTSTSNGDGDFFVVVDSSNGQKKLTKANINLSGFNNDSNFSSTTGTVTSVGFAGDSGSTAISSSGTITFAGGTNVTTSLSGSTLTFNATDTNTTYSAGNGLDLSGTTFSTDLKSNGGLVIESTELAVDLGASSITGTLAIGDGGTGATSASSARTNLGLGSLATLSSVAFSNIAPAAVQLSSESFADNDTTVMTSAAIQDKILSYGYTTNVGDITAVTAGQSLTGGGTSGAVTLAVTDNSISALQLNVSGNGSSGQALTSDGDGTFSWTTMEVGDITGVTAGTGLSGGGTSGSVSLALDLHELTALGSEAATGDYVSIVDSTDNSTKKVLISNLPFGTGSGDITAVVASTGLSGGATSGSATLSIDSTVATLTGTQTLTNKTLTSPTLSTPTLTGLIATTLTAGSEQVTITDESDDTLVEIIQTGTGHRFLVDSDTGSGNSSFRIRPDGKVMIGLAENVVGGAWLYNKYDTASSSFKTNTGGSVGSASFTSVADTNTGMYFPAADTLGLTTGGVERLRLSSSGVQFNGAFTFPTADGSANQILQTDGSGTVSWVDDTTGDITGVTASTGLSGGGTSGTVSLSIDSTVATLTGTQTLTNKTLTTPNLGTPSAINLTNATGFPTLNQNTTGSAATLTTGRTIAMTGDVVWNSGAFNGGGNVTSTSIIQAGAVDIAMLSATGTASSSTYLRGDNTWATIAGDISGVIAGTGLSGGGTSGSVTLNIDSTVATLTGTQTMTNKTLSSPTLTTPDLGTPSAIVLTNATGFPTLNQSTTGSAATLTTGRTIAMTGDVVWNSGAFNGGGNITAASTIQAGAVDLAMLSASGTASSSTYLRGDNTWAAVSGGTTGYTWTDTAGSEQFLISDTSDTALFKVQNAGTGSIAEFHDQASDSNYWIVDQYGRQSIKGTITQGYDLTVAGKVKTSGVFTSAGSASVPQIAFYSDTNTGLYSGGTDILGFSTAGTSRLTIAADGTVDVVGTLDTTNLTIGGAQGSDGQVLTSTGSGVAWEAASSGGATSIGGLSDASTAGTQNVGLGTGAFSSASFNTNNSTALGYNAGQDLTTGSDNVLLGSHAGANLTIGQNNIAIGRNAMTGDTASIHAVAIGSQTGEYSTGDYNISMGSYAGRYLSGHYNIAIGKSANDSGSNSGSGNVVIGNNQDLDDDSSDRQLIIAGNDGTTTTSWIKGVSSGAITFNNAFTFPTGDGSANQVLKTDGSGALSWSTASSGGASSLDGLSDVLIENNSMFVGTVPSNVDGAQQSVSLGIGALQNTTTGDYNTAIGRLALSNLTTGGFTVGVGFYAGQSWTTQSEQVAIGHSAGKTNTGGSNVLVGSRALENDSAGGSNTVVGHWAMQQTEAANNNTMIGYFAGYGNSTHTNHGDSNVAVGSQAFRNFTSARQTVAIGSSAGYALTSGERSTLVGTDALKATTTGHRNLAIGYRSLYVPDTESDNLGIGYEALGGAIAGGEYNIAIGNHSADALTTADKTVMIGYNAGTAITTMTGATLIGYQAGMTATTGTEMTAVGYNAARGVGGTNTATAIGYEALGDASQSYGTTAVGHWAGKGSTGSANTLIGRSAGRAATGNRNTMLGSSVGWNTSSGYGNVLIGSDVVNAGATDSQRLKIWGSNSGGSTHVKWIEGDNSGVIKFNDAYSFPAADGSADQVLTTDGSGTLTFATAGGGGASTLGELTDVLLDATNFTDSILIQTDSDGSAPTTGTLNGATGNIGIGKDVLSTITSADHSIALGYEAGKLITTGGRNVMIGEYAGEAQQTGTDCVIIGARAGRAIHDRSSAVMIGRSAGENAQSTGVVFIGNNAGQHATSDAKGYNIAIGNDAGKYGSNANYSIFMGYAAGEGDSSNTSNNDNNTGIGHMSLKVITTGDDNLGLGYRTLTANTTGSRNLAFGNNSIDAADTESDNIGIGFNALGGAIAGGEKNTSIGNYTLDALSSGDHNVAIGHLAGSGITSGGDNVFIGREAGLAYTSGSDSVIIGDWAGKAQTTNGNVLIGSLVGYNANSTWGNNVAIGHQAALNLHGTGNQYIGDNAGGVSNVHSGAHYNTGIGSNTFTSLTSGGKNIAIGYNSGNNISTGTGNVVIGLADVPSATGNKQLSISSLSDQDGACVWITGTSNGTVNFPASKIQLNGSLGSDGQVLTSTGSGAAWEDAAGGGASDLNGLTDVISNITNFTDSILISPDGAVPPHGTLNNAHSNIGIGKDALSSVTSGSSNVAIGKDAMKSMTTGYKSVAIGYRAMDGATGQAQGVAIGTDAGRNMASTNSVVIGASAGTALTTGAGSVFIGESAGSGITTEAHNIAMGSMALSSGNYNGGTYNIAIGSFVGYAHTSGSNNIGIGSWAFRYLTSGGDNIAYGRSANHGVTTGNRNIAIGTNSYDNADTESDNLAIGYDAMTGAVAGGEFNVAIGNYSLDALTSADDVVAIGYQAGTGLTTGGRNVLIGKDAGKALTHSEQCVIIGKEAGGIGTQGHRNVFIGETAGKRTDGHDNVVIGMEAGDDGASYDQVVFVGRGAGKRWGASDANIAIGYMAGGQSGTASSNDANGNIAIGKNSANAITDGDLNIIVGKDSGSNITSGSNNVVIGGANVASATGDDQLSISSGDGSPVWMTGNSSGVVDFPNGFTNNGASMGANTDSGAFKFTESSRVPMMNGTAGGMTTSVMNGYWAYGNLVSFTESKTLSNAWIYINSLSSGSADTGVVAALYELPSSTLTSSSLSSTLIATATWASSLFVTASGSTGYNSVSWVAASGQSLLLDSSKYYAIMVSNWADNQNTSTPFNILAWSSNTLPNISGSGGNVGVSNGFKLWVNGSTSPAASPSLSNSGTGAKAAIWTTFS